MLQSAMLARHSLLDCFPQTLTPFRIRTYKPSLERPLYQHHLQGPPTNAHSKAPTTLAESPLAQSSRPNSFILRTYKKHGGGVSLPLVVAQHAAREPILGRLQVAQSSPCVTFLHQAAPASLNHQSRPATYLLYPQRLQNSQGGPLQSPLAVRRPLAAAALPPPTKFAKLHLDHP
jgi:hypothetical protein